MGTPHLALFAALAGCDYTDPIAWPRRGSDGRPWHSRWGRIVSGGTQYPKPAPPGGGGVTVRSLEPGGSAIDQRMVPICIRQGWEGVRRFVDPPRPPLPPGKFFSSHTLPGGRVLSPRLGNGTCAPTGRPPKSRYPTMTVGAVADTAPFDNSPEVIGTYAAVYDTHICRGLEIVCPLTAEKKMRQKSDGKSSFL